MEAKPGYQTTEFWLSLLFNLLSVLALLGVITAEEAEELHDAAEVIVAAVMAIIAILGPAMVNVRYIASRTELKKAGGVGQMAGGHES